MLLSTRLFSILFYGWIFFGILFTLFLALKLGLLAMIALLIASICLFGFLTILATLLIHIYKTNENFHKWVLDDGLVICPIAAALGVLIAFLLAGQFTQYKWIVNVGFSISSLILFAGFIIYLIKHLSENSRR